MISDTELSPYMSVSIDRSIELGQRHDKFISPFAQAFYYRWFSGNEKTVRWVGCDGQTIGCREGNAEVIVRIG